jgi:hypothetical protein
MIAYTLVLLSAQGRIDGVEVILAGNKGEAENAALRLLTAWPDVCGYQLWAHGHRVVSRRAAAPRH